MVNEPVAVLTRSAQKAMLTLCVGKSGPMGITDHVGAIVTIGQRFDETLLRDVAARRLSAAGTGSWMWWPQQ